MEEKDQFNKFEGLYWHVSRNLNLIWKKIFAEYFPGSQSYIMWFLEKNGAKKMTELAEAIDLTPGAVTSLSDKLIANGYINRYRDEEDRRVVYLEITPTGKETLNLLRKEGRNKMKMICNDISETDLEHIVRIFEQISGNIEKVQEEEKNGASD
ncbi:MarR family winged helix-turn-helix transcriptional regulator [Brevibacillus daliensis]|uniref:MarR family winged helix-turn-helix transcriptional regulator n=1 Tax=Brevibacillus daliensis TaxID=2892995 RepID=UPI001E45301B|nr:MarR family transcriptional regulator [Brevibacillus daliensis]